LDAEASIGKQKVRDWHIQAGRSDAPHSPVYLRPELSKIRWTPEPHLLMNPRHVARYTELMRNALAELELSHATDYEERTHLFTQRLHELDCGHRRGGG
jgi:ABC-type Zn uptake system ZnuABC Zn-binding protein ZnuA